jgi:hypothetical protein
MSLFHDPASRTVKEMYVPDKRGEEKRVEEIFAKDEERKKMKQEG